LGVVVLGRSPVVVESTRSVGSADRAGDVRGDGLRGRRSPLHKRCFGRERERVLAETLWSRLRFPIGGSALGL
jgi:hypothetical protein